MKVTFGELRRDVALFAAAMRKMGVQTGDRVVGESFFFFFLNLWPSACRVWKAKPSLIICRISSVD